MVRFPWMSKFLEILIHPTYPLTYFSTHVHIYIYTYMHACMHTGVEVGINIYAQNRPACNKLKSSITSSYGHLTDYLHATRSKVLKHALVFDVHSYIVSYQLLPGGVVYGQEKEDSGDDDARDGHSGGRDFFYLFGPAVPWLLQGDLSVLAIILVPLFILAILYWRAVCGGGGSSWFGSGSHHHHFGSSGKALRIHRKSWGGEKVEFISDELRWERNRAITSDQTEYLCDGEYTTRNRNTPSPSLDDR